MENLGPRPPVIIRRIVRRRHEDHGGAWKVAMADFALAMMALFLVLWIINNSSEEQRMAISGFFQDPKAYDQGKLMPSSSPIDLGGSPSVLTNQGDEGDASPDSVIELRQNRIRSPDANDDPDIEALKERIEQLIMASQRLGPFRNQIMIDITREGLRLQIVDLRDRPMFESGSADLRYYTEDILWELAPIMSIALVGGVKLAITGHTDNEPGTSSQYPEDDGNWRLSALRADAARKALMEAGVTREQIAEVIGVGDTQPYDPANPSAPINRRIVLLLQNPKPGENAAAALVRQKAGVEQSGSQLKRLQQQRDRPDNPYDNPPNQLE
jgi:chemotaxis protein MotB